MNTEAVGRPAAFSRLGVGGYAFAQLQLVAGFGFEDGLVPGASEFRVSAAG